MHPAVEYHLIRATEELIDFIPQWRRLFARDPNATPFQSADWLVPWWRHFGGRELCVVALMRAGVPVGLLPFYIYCDAAKGQRQLLPLGVGTTDYLDGVFAPECSTEIIGRAIEWLRGEVKHDVFCVTQLPNTSRLLKVFRQRSAFRNRGSEVGQNETDIFVSHAEPCSRMPAVTMAELPQKIRRNAMYYRNRALRCGSLELVQADDANCGAIFGELVRLHASRWKVCGEEGVLVDERVLAWHREAIPLLLESGMLRLMALRLNGEIIAVLYSLVDRRRAGRTQYFYITAYSPDYADLRPGTLLIAYATEHAAREGLTTIDMLRGNEGYKQVWHMEKVPTWCCTQYQAIRADADREASAA